HSKPARCKKCTTGGIPDAWFLAAYHRFLRVRFPCGIYRIASPFVHFRQGSRHVVLWQADFGSRARRLGHRLCRPVQHPWLFDLGLARERISEKGHAGTALRLARAGIRDVSRFASVMDLSATVLGFARVPLAWHRSAD